MVSTLIIDGAHSFADAWRARRLLIGGIFWLNLAAFVAMVLGLIGVGLNPTKYPPYVLAVGGMAWLYLAIVRPFMTLRRDFKVGRGLFERVSGNVASESITIHTQHSDVTHQWQAFRRCRIYERVVILEFEQPNMYLVITPGWFPKLDAWQTFCNLANEKLPYAQCYRCKSLIHRTELAPVPWWVRPSSVFRVVLPSQILPAPPMLCDNCRRVSTTMMLFIDLMLILCASAIAWAAVRVLNS